MSQAKPTIDYYKGRILTLESALIAFAKLPMKDAGGSLIHDILVGYEAGSTWSMKYNSLRSPVMALRRAKRELGIPEE